MAQSDKEPDFALPTDSEASPDVTSEPDFDLPSSADEPPSALADIIPSVGTGIAKGAMKLPGFIGSMGQAYDAAGNLITKGVAKGAEALGLLPKGKTAADLTADLAKLDNSKSDAEKSGDVNKIFGLPFITEQGSYNLAKKAVGEPSYKPSTPVGRVSEEVGESLPSAVLMPGKTAAAKVVNMLGAAVPSAVAGEATKDTPYELAARIVGSVVGSAGTGLGSVIATARSEPATVARAMDIAGKAIRERYPNWQDAYDRLRSYLSNPPAQVPGVNPTSAQIERLPAATSLENDASKSGTTGAGTLQGNQKASIEAVKGSGTNIAENVSEANKPTDLADAFGVSGNARINASEDARKAIQKVDDEYSRAEDGAWSNLQDQQGILTKDAVVKNIDSYLDGLDSVSRKAIPGWINQQIEAIRNSPDRAFPIAAIQKLRSLTLSAARNAAQSETPIHAPDLNKFAGALENTLMDPNSFVFGSQGAPAAWKAATQATRARKQLFGNGALSDLTQGEGNAMQVSPEATISKIFTGPNAAQNLRAAMALPGAADDVGKAVSNYMVGQLTNDGDKVALTSKDVSKFMANPKNGAIIREVPGLADRLNGIAQQAGESESASTARQLNDRFRYIVQNGKPTDLKNWLFKYGDDLKSTLPNQDQKNLVDQLKNSAETISSLPSPQAATTDTYKNLLKNDMFTLLYGRAAGRMADATETAAVLGTLTHMPVLGAVLGGFGAARRWSPEVLDKFSQLFFGGTKDQALEMMARAAHDPEFKALLMQRPSPDGVAALYKMIKQAPANAAARAAVAVTPQTDTDRTQRKSGGRVVNHKRAAEKLMQAAEKARKFHVKRTEPLLQKSDDAVASALAVANRNI